MGDKMTINPLDIVAKGMKINPQITRRLFPAVVLVALVALASQVVHDPTTAIFGGLFLVLGSVILLIVSAIAAQQIGAIAKWFTRFVAFLFVAISATLVISWITERPKPLSCLINPLTLCFRAEYIAEKGPQIGPVCLRPDEPLPAASCDDPGGNYVVTNVRWDDPEGLNVREMPNIGGHIMGSLKANTTGLTVGACDHGWCQVQCKSLGLSGWSRDRYLALRSSVLYSVKGISQAALGLAIRNGPDRTCTATSYVPYDGRDVTIHSCQVSRNGSSEWCLITHESGSGWVPPENFIHQN
jgi:SH3-like domain-containing protein